MNGDSNFYFLVQSNRDREMRHFGNTPIVFFFGGNLLRIDKVEIVLEQR